MEIKLLAPTFSVCKIHDLSEVDLSEPYIFLAKTDDELSLVCPSERTPKETIIAEHGWRAMKIVGMLDFGMVGVIARISQLLADAGIPLFVISTYNTDYVLVKQDVLDRTLALLGDAGYQMS
ncbi:ACT domain-containing protein [Eubacteriales bacterium OttesenSCG-928-N13]|nr:ACT domain-containing protein [Eubacteriales bacterium OttesenSCG-928-N13]